jgi:hypothetical protein
MLNIKQVSRNARREFTGGFFGILRGGPIKPNDIVTRFYESNKARFNVQKEMFKNIDAAQILGVNANSLRQTFQDRQLTTQTFNNLRRGKYEPYFPSDDIRERFREIAKNLGTFDVFQQVLPALRAMTRDMRRLRLDGVFEKNITTQEFAEGGAAYTPTLAETYGGGIDLNDYLIDTSPVGPAALPPQPMPSPQVVQTMPQAPGIMNQGLTPTENALLSEEEKQIRLRQRGLA